MAACYCSQTRGGADALPPSLRYCCCASAILYAGYTMNIMNAVSIDIIGILRLYDAADAAMPPDAAI